MDKNTVTLVGAGCSKELLTLRGLEEIKKADVIVYDDLIDRDILLEAKKDCELIYVGKRLGKHSENQDQINKIIINKARENKYVVRLKGGDSFVFGRGGEEVQALLKENIPFEVVPGVSSCIAAAEKTGIPVTHRGVSQSFTVVTGHTASEKDENYQALAKLDGTLVFLMGLSNIGQIAKKLIENGKDKNTPCSVLSRV
ncbi:MAG: uroporphyrinogen-III C-methyltransferase, partial [Acutalibacteraceae bacterium]